MGINEFESIGRFEQNFESQFHHTESMFRAINPYFFNFLRPDGAVEEDIEPLMGVKISWSSESKLPFIILEDLALNEEAQLFYQMYGNQLVAIGM